MKLADFSNARDTLVAAQQEQLSKSWVEAFLFDADGDFQEGVLFNLASTVSCFYTSFPDDPYDRCVCVKSTYGQYYVKIKDFRSSILGFLLDRMDKGV